jgi:hypothetical protein
MRNISWKSLLNHRKNIAKNCIHLAQFTINKIFKNLKGGIVVEFAFAVPLLIMVLYFCMDVPQVYRITANLQRTSELYAQLLLNVIKMRISKELTQLDLKNISQVVGFTFTGIEKGLNHPFYLSTYITYIEGSGSDKMKVKWCVHLKNKLSTTSVDVETERYDYSAIQASTTQLSSIKSLSGFAIQKGEFKLLIETVIWCDDSPTERGFNKYFVMISIPGTKKGNAKILGSRFAIVTPPKGMVSDSLPK